MSWRTAQAALTAGDDLEMWGKFSRAKMFEDTTEVRCSFSLTTSHGTNAPASRAMLFFLTACELLKR